MKRTILKGANALRTALISVLVAAIALLALPFGLFARNRSAVAEAEKDSAVMKPRNAFAGGEVTLTVNYFRSTADYTGWNMWIWVVGSDGSQKDFTKLDVTTANTGDKKWASTGEIKLSGVPTEGDAIGFIVRKGEWEEKDPDMDRFVDASMIGDDGKVTIWCRSGDETFYDKEEEIGMPVIKSAIFNSETTVYFTTSTNITNTSVFKVKEKDTGTVVGTLDCTVAGTFGVGRSYSTVTFDEGKKIDFAKSYVIVDEPTGTPNLEKNFTKPKDINKNTLYGTPEFEEAYMYKGTLGVEYTAQKSKFTVWAPFASEVTLNLYETGNVANDTTADPHPMTKGANGSWSVEVERDLAGKYYTYSVKNGSSVTEVVDPYARSAGQDGKRGMIVDFSSAKATPDGWATQKEPTLKSNSEAVIYEAHLRDLTISPTSGVSEKNRGKFLGLTEENTTVNGVEGGSPTALAYLKALGVTQVHFQPLFDFASVKEYTGNAKFQDEYDPKEAKDGQFNWGYDPLNYNVPEGSYSSDPTDGYARVKEMRAMIQALHNAGMQVVMDVVYNHVSDANGSNFEALAPGYFFRTNTVGALTNGSGCGNETASERYMFRRFMIDSVKYWTNEFKIDGFRFDLMGLHDTVTMNELTKELKAINPDVIIYGEGWTGGTSGMDSAFTPATLANAGETPDIAYFDDVVRDKLKGGVFDIAETGFVSGKGGTDGAVYYGATGAVSHNDVSYILLGKSPFASSPIQNINYVSSHDNSALWDKLNASVKADEATLKAMNRMAAAAVMTSQGASFFLAGEEMLRSKKTTATKITNADGSYALKDEKYDGRPNEWVNGSEPYYFSDNSYKSPDRVNAINWALTDTNKDMVDFYRELIAIKKTFPQFHITKKADIAKNVTILDKDQADGVAWYVVKDPASDEYVVVAFNNNAEAKKISVPNATYDIHVNGDKAKAAEALETFTGSELTVGARSVVIMKTKLGEDAFNAWVDSVKSDAKSDDKGSSNLGLALGLGIGIPAAVLIAGGVVFGVMYSKKKKGASGKGEEPKTDDEPKSDEPKADEPAAEEPKAEEGETPQE